MKEILKPVSIFIRGFIHIFILIILKPVPLIKITYHPQQ